MGLESVKIKAPNDLMSCSLLGKLGGDQELHQYVESMIINKEIIERPHIIITRLQDYASLYKDRKLPNTETSTTLLIHIYEPHKIVYFCKHEKYNNKSTNH
ncbi:hypothetical protein O181_073114 [Austropuccinia psidii MF-1]|uniref:Uncharacterized protein n=1 Tax=Austropuccinia psidii MF-1 TaxID=1389203 RepID=A0A9Q3F622_9BASI|nr:hypothetical protein [Austropuccinia psidii MF-1]